MEFLLSALGKMPVSSCSRAKQAATRLYPVSLVWNLFGKTSFFDVFVAEKYPRNIIFEHAKCRQGRA
ncbi:hypothetical protein [Desulfovibrio sp. An276]|uniref:hypothetical protein n=1 Tax=Desulfovibrio sp. An276 TaxID=1965618 RepID=UPI0013A648CC|nr:hypothetical protein [Desulfovibrio sp. An276]